MVKQVLLQEQEQILQELITTMEQQLEENNWTSTRTKRKSGRFSNIVAETQASYTSIQLGKRATKKENWPAQRTVIMKGSKNKGSPIQMRCNRAHGILRVSTSWDKAAKMQMAGSFVDNDTRKVNPIWFLQHFEKITNPVQQPEVQQNSIRHGQGYQILRLTIYVAKLMEQRRR